MTMTKFSGLFQSDNAELISDLSRQGYSIQPGMLDTSTCAALLEQASLFDQQDTFHPGSIAHSGAESSNSIRQDKILWLEPGQSPITDAFLAWTETLRISINRSLFLGLAEYEAHLASYAPGCGYKTHLDRARGNEARVLTLIVYLSPDWKLEDGGQLRLYLDSHSHIDVLPRAGTVVAFLSADFWHEVLPGNRERWAITGWYRQRTS